jgi:hypothetical protein
MVIAMAGRNFFFYLEWFVILFIGTVMLMYVCYRRL